MRTVGTTARGIRLPIIHEGDDLVQITADAVIAASENEGFAFHDRDVVSITEAVVARAQGNYASLDQIAADVRAKFPSGTVGVLFPILSRNRFSLLMKGIAMGADRVVIQLSYPDDEVGNPLFSLDMLDESGIDPYTDVLTETRYREIFGYNTLHPFTGMDYVEFYKNLNPNIEVILANNPAAILEYTKQVICADIHTRRRTERRLKAAGAEKVMALDNLLTESVNGSGYNEKFGLYGSNKATEDSVKLFPRDCDAFVNALARILRERTGKNIEVMVYGDGAFKDPVGGIWELADPVVSPSYTKGLEGTPNELKLKYLADTDFKGLTGAEAEEAMRERIRSKDANLVGRMESEGTTPRRLTDLLGSLSDLTSGSGDKGTPVVLIQGYFDNYASE